MYKQMIGVSARILLGVIVTSFLMACTACGTARSNVVYTPIPGEDWRVSTPLAEGLEPSLVDRLYARAAREKSTLGVLLVKNGALISEAYFNGAAIDQATRIQSVTKSITSALTGIAIAQGHIGSIDDPLIEYLPEFSEQIRDSRKKLITIRHLLQMQAGYPWEESSEELFNALYGGLRPRYFLDFPLMRTPGEAMEYSNLTAHLLGMVITRATDTSLPAYAQEYLFDPIGAELGEWLQLWEGFYGAAGDLSLTARSMASFGQLYLDNGRYRDQQIIPKEWVQESLRAYSTDVLHYRVGKNYEDISYGYMWWSAKAGDRTFYFAWGHGGQLIALVPDHQIVVVVKADPQFGQHNGRAWRAERANLNFAADFIASLP